MSTLKKALRFLLHRFSPPICLSKSILHAGSDESLFRWDCQLKQGYYMVECQGCFSNSFSLSVHIYQSGKNRFTALPVLPDKVAKRVVWVKEGGGVTINFEVGEQQVSIPGGADDSVTICFVPLIKYFATSRMISRLGSDKSTITSRAKQFKQSFDDYLYCTYDHSFQVDAVDAYQNWISGVELWGNSCGRLKQSKMSVESEFTLFLNDGYEVAPNDLMLLSQIVVENPSACVVYTDEDQIDLSGRRLNHFFKPGWNPDLFLSADYLSAGYLCRNVWYQENKKAFERFGVRAGLAYLLPKLKPGQILHVPYVLLHQKVQVALLDESNRRKAPLQELLKEEGVRLGKGGVANSFRLSYSLPAQLPKVCLLIPTRDSLDLLRPCVESILHKTTYSEFEVLIINNQSHQGETKEWLINIQRDERVTVLDYDHPFNYSAINNFGVQHAKGSIIGLINNDIEVISPDWLTEMVSHACRPEIGCVGAKLYYSNGQIQHAGIILSEHNIAMHGHRYFDGDADGYHGRLKLVQNYSAVTGACLVVRKEIYEQVGGLNEKHLAVAYNDVDFCLKVREAGYRNLWTPYAELYHHESMSRGSDDTPKKRKRLNKEAAYMRKRWGKELANDPCYNPNLTPLKEDFSLRVI